MQRWRIKWGLQCAELIQHNAQRPDIRAHGVGLGLDHLGAQVVGRSYAGARLLDCGREDLCDSKITDLDNTLFSQEDILGLEVSVNDLPVVNVLHAQANLSKPVEHLRFGEVLAPLCFNFV